MRFQTPQWKVLLTDNKQKIMKYKICLSILIVFYTCTFGIRKLFCQTLVQTPSYTNISTPNVASFNKFIDNPVDKYHGRPDVTIPLYTIKDCDIELPISIRYNTSGIKVNEDASWVGLGWNLNLGGVITQNIIGQYDEYDTHYEDFMSDGFFDSTQGMDIEGIWEGGYFNLIYYLDVYNKLHCALAGHDYCTRQLAKIRPDVFYFSYPGNSGKFIIDYLNGNIPCVLSKEENINIQIIYEENTYPGIRGFKVITPKGVIHTFDSPLEMKTTDGGYSDISTVSYNLNSTSYPNGQTIQYYYTTVNVSNPNCNETNITPATLVNGFSGSDYERDVSYFSGKESYLDSITTSSYKVAFETSSREDVQNGKKLLKVTIDEKNSQAVSPVIEFSFDYSYFISNELLVNDYYWNIGIFGWPYGSGYATKRLKLDAIVSKNKGLEKHRHNLIYNEIKLPRKDSYAVDYWGYFNGKIYNKSMIPDFNNLYYPYINGMTENRQEETTYINSIINSFGLRPGSDRSYDFDYAQAAVLKGIEYPTGGYTEFKYEPNTFSEMGVKRKDGYLPEYYIPTSQEITESTTYLSVSDYNVGGDGPRIDTFSVNNDCEGTITVTIARGDRTWEDLLSLPYVIAIRSTDGQYNGWSYHEFGPVSGDNQQIVRQIPLKSGEYEIEVDLPASTYPTGYIVAYLSFPQRGAKPIYSKGCGFRVKTINHYNSKDDTNPVLTTNYNYNNPGSNNSSGILFDYLSFVNTQRITYDYTKYVYNGGGYPISIIGYDNILDMHYISGSNKVSNPYGKSSGVGYSYVKEEREGQNAGSSLFEFHNHKIFYWPHEFISEADEPSINSYPILNGKTKMESFYDSENNVIKKERFFFNAQKAARFLSVNTLNNFNRNVEIFQTNTCSGGYPCVACFPKTYVEYYGTGDASIHVQELFSHNITLESKEMELDGVLTIDTLIYNDKLLLKSRESKTSNGDIKKITYNYPSDINQGIYTDMVNNGMFDYPIEQTIKTNGKWTGSNLTTYKFEEGNYVPDKVYSLETTAPLTSFPEYIGSSVDTNYYGDNPEIDFLEHDYRGNILKIKEINEIYTYYLWAYNKQYPVAKIETSIDTTISVTVIDNNLSKSDELSSIKNDVTYLKELLATYLSNSKCIVTLYTYKPLVGMTSQTDPNGLTTYYEYDDFGRLSLIRDHNDQILKKYDYHYASQSAGN